MTYQSHIPSRIVVRGTNWVGDTIISLPALREIRRIFASSHIIVWVRRELYDLIHAAGVADEIVTFDANSEGPVRRALHMRRTLAKLNLQLAILLQNAFESAFTSWLARVPLRAGYPTDLRGLLLNIKVPMSPQVRESHQVFYYLAITDYLEHYFHGKIDRQTSKPPDCSILIPPESFAAANLLLNEAGVTPERPFYCLAAGSANSEAKRWLPEYFANLADLIIEQKGGQIVLMGAPGERDLLAGIASNMKKPGAVNLAGTTNILTSMAVMKLSEAVISNDTGSAHLAVAAAASVLTIFGPTIPGATAPYGHQARLVVGKADCAPCHHYRCPVQGHPCMSSVSPEMILSEITKITSGMEDVPNSTDLDVHFVPGSN